jgi:hypothetical protein
MQSQTQVLRKRTWAHEEAERACSVVEILNDEYSAPISKQFKYSISNDLVSFLVDLKRIEAIRRELLKSEKVRDPKPPSHGWPKRRVSHTSPDGIVWPKLAFPDAALEALTSEGQQIMTRLNKCLSRFRTYPLLYSYRFTPIRMMRRWTGTEERILGRSIEEILEYFQRGLLERFRVCGEPECKRWFFAITNHQRYCGEACRIRHVAQSQSFKEKRARYMREKYRPQIKQLEERAKQLASKRRG